MGTVNTPTRRKGRTPGPALLMAIKTTLGRGRRAGIAVGAGLWMTRFEGGEAPSTNLDAILCEDFDVLREARVVEDARIEVYTGWSQ